MLNVVSSGMFYNTYISLPDASTPLTSIIRDNPKFYPYFKDVLGAINGTHFDAWTSSEERHASRDRKGRVSQNTLFACDVDLKFLYGITGFEGSTADATLYTQARLMNFKIPEGKCYLADAGFAVCDTLLVPYRGVRYHLAEWGRAAAR